MNTHFTEEDLQMTNKHKKRCLTSLATREMENKTSIRYNYIPIRMAKMKNNNIIS